VEHRETTCGQELAESANVPDQFGCLFEHVALNLREHAAWVGTGSAAARREHDAMIAVAEGYEEIASTAARTASLMRTLHDIPPVTHDPRSRDALKFHAWMTRKIELQRELATLLTEHAQQSEQVLGLLQRDQHVASDRGST
jgi:hypothetical protein